MKGIIGRKAGMTQVYLKDGRAVPVTVIQIKPNVVTQIKTVESNGYDSIQLGYEDKKDARATRAHLGHMKKANTGAKYFVKEIRDFNLEGAVLGQELKADLFQTGEFVDIQGISKGKGFTGPIKRHNQTRGPMAHGSKYHRGVGSLGDIASAVKKGMPMAGHHGVLTTTVQNLEVIDVDLENNVLLIKGSVPGANRGFLIIKSAVKISDLSKKPAQLVDVLEQAQKDEIILEGQKVDAVLNSEMSLEEMKTILEQAKVDFVAKQETRKALEIEATKLGVQHPEKLSDEDLNRDVDGLKKKAEEAAAPAEEAKTEEVKEDAAPAEESKTEEK